MAFLNVNGYDYPPCKRGVKIINSTVVDAARNTNGVTVGQKIGRDLYKIDGLEWAVLTAEEWSRILKSLEPFYVNLTFWDDVDNKKRTILVYPGDRSAEPYFVNSEGKPTLFRNCKVNLIDTGKD